MSRAGGYAADRKIIHVDMDAFYASVEVLDDPSLKGKPVIVGSRPNERGVVSTCSYEARRYGIHSAMNIKEAYRLCPNGVYMRPNFEKYKRISEQLHEIWDSYATSSEPIALDEAFLDVTGTAVTFEKAREFAHAIKERVLNEVGLSCSVGLAYSKTAAKIASEEMKPDGYFEIRTPEEYMELIMDRDVNVLYGVGKKTAERLHKAGINTVRDVLENTGDVIDALGNNGEQIIEIAKGIDDREVTPYRPEDAKSISREITFQVDVSDYDLLSDVLFLIALNVEERAKSHGLHGTGVSLKVTYSDMKSITRSRNTASTVNAVSIHREAVSMLMALKKRPVRLIGAGMFNVTNSKIRQMTLDEIFDDCTGGQPAYIRNEFAKLKDRYRIDFESNLDQIFYLDSLHKTAELMRKRRLRPGNLD